MNNATTQNRATMNSQYLLKALTPIYQRLVHYAKRQQEQEAEDLPHDNSLQELENFVASFDSLPNLEKLRQTFNLSVFERNILLLCVGKAIFADFPYLFTQAHHNPRMDYPTFGLAMELFEQSHWSAFIPQSPLRRWQLILTNSIQEDITLVPIRIDECILHYLFGEYYHDPHLDKIIKNIAIKNIILPHSQEKIVEKVVNYWTNFVFDSSFPIIQLCGLEIANQIDIATVACALNNFSLKRLSVACLPPSLEQVEILKQRWEREAILQRSVLLLDCHDDPIDRSQNLAINYFIEEINTPLILIGLERKKLSCRSLICFEVPKLTYQEQLDLWKNYLSPFATELNGQVEQLTSYFNLSSATIKTACCQLNLNQNQFNSSDFGQQLWDFCRTQSRPKLEDLAQRVETNATWDDLILPEREKQTLSEITAHLRQRSKVYEQWGFAGKERRGLGISALFSGQSGTGKTMAAGVLAKTLNLDLYRIDLSAVVSKYIGETEKNLRLIFDAAETGGAILLFDEADALFGKRTEVKDSHDRHANVEVSYLLQRMEAYQGLAILTTNLKNTMDTAFMRRIRFVVPFPFPDAEARQKIWLRIFPSQTPTAELDFNKLGKLNVSGGNIRNIALNSAMLAANANEPIMMKHILQAAKSEYLKLERTLTDLETKGWI
jgi:AAA+ superfamily predicted ATPase